MPRTVRRLAFWRNPLPKYLLEPEVFPLSPQTPLEVRKGLTRRLKQKTLNHWVVGSIPTRCMPKFQRLTIDSVRSLEGRLGHFSATFWKSQTPYDRFLANSVCASGFLLFSGAYRKPA
jgi:hypothetical protein